MADNPSPLERRRRAPWLFWQAAENARFSSRVLWATSPDAVTAIADEIFCGDATPEGMREAFRREAAIALELVIKTVIAQRIENETARRDVLKVRPVHDLPALWGEASLPSLPHEDVGRLVYAKYVLLWTGQYPAPNTDGDYRKMTAELSKYEDTKFQLGRLRSTVRLSFTWDDFDRIYQTAADTFRAIVPQIDEDGWLIIPEGPRKFTRD